MHQPHYLLSVATRADGARPAWRFTLRASDGREEFSAEEIEPGTRRDRLELLAVVRGLEALQQPSRVTIDTRSAYVRHGMADGLDQWRASGWTWDRFGQQTLVPNHDLWQRLDRALAIHQAHCRQWRFDGPHVEPARQRATRRQFGGAGFRPRGIGRWLRRWLGAGPPSLANRNPAGAVA